MLRGKLRTVRPIDLVAVILLGIVACGDIKSRGRAVMTHGKAQLRRGAQSVENAYMNAVCRHDAGCLMSKQLTVIAAVKANGNTLFHCLGAFGFYYICKGLSCVANDMDIHLVESELHSASESCRTELERCEKAAFNFLLIVGYRLELLPLLFAEIRAVKPKLVFFLIIPHILRSLPLN